MSDDTKPIAQATGTTNTTPQSVVTVKAKPLVQVTYRLFAANATAELSGQHKQSARTLHRFPHVLGLVAGGKIQAFDPRIGGLPAPTALEGSLQNGSFQEITAAERTQRSALTAQAKDKTLSATERDKAKAQLAAQFGHVCKTLAHVVTVPKRIEPGTTVGICFGVDVKSKFRQYPLWQVTAADHDIVVDVFETFGKHALDDSATQVTTLDLGTKEAPKPTDYYVAKLTGNLWMRSTHPFTDADVDALPKDAASDTVKLALKRIYAGDFDVEKSGDFGIEVASGEASDADRKLVTLSWIAGENDNCTSNISGLDLKSEVPRRIHPAAYAAVARAAHEAGVTAIKFTSSWRPMMGSAAHRLGLGLDLKWLVEGSSAVQLNRAGLLNKSVTDKNKDGVVDGTKNIAVDEQQAFNDWKAAEAASNSADSALRRASAGLVAATKALAVAKKTGNADKIEKAQHEADEADKASVSAKDARDKAAQLDDSKKQDWNDKLKEHEPGVLGRYRRYVMKEDCITQVIDPWYIDLNTHDKTDPVPNEQANAIQKIHNNHMHLTIRDKDLHE